MKIKFVLGRYIDEIERDTRTEVTPEWEDGWLNVSTCPTSLHSGPHDATRFPTTRRERYQFPWKLESRIPWEPREDQNLLGNSGVVLTPFPIKFEHPCECCSQRTKRSRRYLEEQEMKRRKNIQSAKTGPLHQSQSAESTKDNVVLDVLVSRNQEMVAIAVQGQSEPSGSAGFVTSRPDSVVPLLDNVRPAQQY